ncbi:hypothetical protein E2X65_11825 [Salmonella enterica]|nr:hypothetical protein [Salmonella enterica]
MTKFPTWLPAFTSLSATVKLSAGESAAYEQGNIVALKEILGHANIQQTRVDAHLMPGYPQHAILLNPLRGGMGEKLAADTGLNDR